ncbi:hypothetical protein ABC468_02805 [Mycoplasmopsis synoviae]|uniref:hypothetical protein n=1 Tax=Mycoplasmopsis synoviae TaxID=2109 RepID=UPI001E38C8A9|nr:hypothetical protein [Mycoplasmopsis synoviae]
MFKKRKYLITKIKLKKKNSRRRKRNRKKLKKANVNEITSEVQKVVLVENSETQNTETEKVE